MPQTDETRTFPQEICSRGVAASQEDTGGRLRHAEDLFTTPWERLVQSLADRDLARLLEERGVEVDAISMGVKPKRDPNLREVDLLAVNAEEAVAVEVKTTLRPPDVDAFLELLQDLPTLMKTFVSGRLYGAVAYLREHQGTARYAARKGLFVIRATGSSASIVNAPEFRPRAFHAPAP